MIILDTNVLSELMRSEPDSGVVGRVDSWPAGEIYLTSITVAEILYGLARMPESRRRTEMADVAAAMFEEDFRGRVLSFDQGCAVEYAALVIDRERRGRPISMADAQIAAICRGHNATLATRKTSRSRTLDLIDPWSGNSG